MFFPLTAVALCVGAAAGEGQRPTVAVLPPRVAGDGDAWIGYAVADDLANRLLVHSRFDPKTLSRNYPLNVFSWRQAESVARGEGIDLRASKDDKALGRIGRELGADGLFYGDIEVSGGKATLTWRLVPVTGAAVKLAPSKPRKLVLTLDQIAQATEGLADDIIRAVGHSPEHAGGHHLTSIPMAAMRPFGEAVAILARQSFDPRARLVLPRLDIERAHALLTASTDAAPAFVRAWVERGLASSLLGQSERAEEELVQALAQAGELEPSVAVGLYYLYERQGKSADALKALEDAVQSHLGFLQGQAYLGSAYLRAARSHDALTLFTALVARTPRSPWARLMRATALSRIGEHQKAVEETRAVAKDFPGSLSAQIALASRLIDASQLDAAGTLLTELLRENAEHPALLTRLSYIDLEKGKIAAALALAEKAVTALGDGRGEPLAGYAHLNLGHALARSGRDVEAYAALKKAVELGIGADDRLLIVRDKNLSRFLNDPRSAIRPQRGEGESKPCPSCGPDKHQH